MRKTCAICSKEYETRHRTSVFCSYTCSAGYRSRKASGRAMQRFQSKIRVDANGCWLWTDALDPAGYGAFTMVRDGRRRKINAHRASYVLHNGMIPNGAMVCHTCDVRDCVNPSHLFLGDAAINSKDMLSKGRGFSKLNADQVREIRRRAHAGENKSALGREFGVTRNTVLRIANGLSWSYV
jgi:hypothetical protein